MNKSKISFSLAQIESIKNTISSLEENLLSHRCRLLRELEEVDFANIEHKDGCGGTSFPIEGSDYVTGKIITNLGGLICPEDLDWDSYGLS